MKCSQVNLIVIIFIILFLSGCVEQTATESKKEQTDFQTNIPPIIQVCQVEYFDRWNSATVYFLGSAIDYDGSIVTYRWDLSDGYICMEPAFIHTFQQPGAYHAALTVVDNNGVSNSTDIMVYITGSLSTNQTSDQKQFIGTWENSTGNTVEFTIEGYYIPNRKGVQNPYWFGENILYVHYLVNKNIVQYKYYFQGKDLLVFYPVGDTPVVGNQWRKIS